MQLFLLILLATFAVAGLTALLVSLYNNHVRKQHQSTQHKFSDAQVFAVMSSTNHFITSKQLATVSPLNEKEAQARLYYLMFYRVLMQYVCSADWTTPIYQLKEDIPQSSQFPIPLQGLTDKQVIEQILHYAEDYQITIPELVVIFGIDIYEAKALIARLVKSKLIQKLYKNFQAIYVLHKPLQRNPPVLYNRKASRQKIKIPTTQKMKIPDAEVLQLAIDNQGKLTTEELCLRLQIPLTEAKDTLENLYEQGAFRIDINLQSNVMEYHLVDDSLMKL